MKRINQYQYYHLSASLKPLASYAEGQKLQVIAWPLQLVKVWLRWLLGGNLGHELVVSRESASKLLDAVATILPDAPSGLAVPEVPEDRVLTWSAAYSLRNTLQEFETIFSAEVATLASYIVSKKGIYDTADLIERAENAIDETARDEIGSAAKSDFQQAGKCLAFELPTASGYHTMRATEAVVRNYWALVRKSNPASISRPPDMAVCINELRAQGEDPKLMDALDHIKDLHRNTLMHPEAFLNMKDALRLFDIAKSAISLMGDRIKELRDAATKEAARLAIIAQAEAAVAAATSAAAAVAAEATSGTIPEKASNATGSVASSAIGTA